jgi:hypothetical protein
MVVEDKGHIGGTTLLALPRKDGCILAEHSPISSLTFLARSCSRDAVVSAMVDGALRFSDAN